MLRVVAFVLLVMAPGIAPAKDYFTCRSGQRPGCLDYGDKVCDFMAKCVDERAICFESYTCDYKGFVCKSSLDKMADELTNLLTKAREVATAYDDLRDCVESASTLVQAKLCP